MLRVVGGAQGGTAKCEGSSLGLCGGCESHSCEPPALHIQLSTPPPSCPNPHHSADGSHTTPEGSVLPSPSVLQAAGGSVGGSAGCASDLLELAVTAHKLLGGARRFLQWAVGSATTSGADGYTVGGGAHDSSALGAVGVPLPQSEAGVSGHIDEHVATSKLSSFLLVQTETLQPVGGSMPLASYAFCTGSNTSHEKILPAPILQASAAMPLLQAVGGAEGGIARCEGSSLGLRGGCKLHSCESPIRCIQLSTPPPSRSDPPADVAACKSLVPCVQLSAPPPSDSELHHSAGCLHTTTDSPVLPSSLVLQQTTGQQPPEWA
eukprot:5185304-Prymnesium_polylepis.1